MQTARELRARLWQSQAPHPGWKLGQRWPQQVSSCAIDDGERLPWFDPLAVPEALLALGREREPEIVLIDRDRRSPLLAAGRSVSKSGWPSLSRPSGHPAGRLAGFPHGRVGAARVPAAIR